MSLRLIDVTVGVTVVCTKCGKTHKADLHLGHGKEDDRYYGKVKCCGKTSDIDTRPKYLDISLPDDD